MFPVCNQVLKYKLGWIDGEDFEEIDDGALQVPLEPF